MPEAYAEQALELVRADLSGELRRVKKPSQVRHFASCPHCQGELESGPPVSREVTAGERRFVVWSKRRTCRECGGTL